MITRRQLLGYGITGALFSGTERRSLGESPPRGSAPTEATRFTHTHPTMGTVFRFIAYARDEVHARKAFLEAGMRLDALNLALSDYVATSELSRLSAASGNGSWRLLREDLWRVLHWGQRLSSQCRGAFDMTVGPMTRLWRVSRRNGKLPSSRRLEEARQATGFRHLSLDGSRRRAQLTRPGMRLDLGGIAKGYAVDQVLACLQSHGIRTALVDGGGDLRVVGTPPEKAGWSIAIEDLQESSARANEGSKTTPLADTAVATSGDLYQSIQIGGREFSHIIDPKTGLGLEYRRSVTVLAPTAMMADALASALSVLSHEESASLLDEHYPTASARILTLTNAGLDTRLIGRGPSVKILEEL